MTQELGPDGSWLHKEPKVEIPTDANVMRQFEVEIIMSIEAAKVVHGVLENFIDVAEQMIKNQPVK